jgi:hypothetical protein
MDLFDMSLENTKYSQSEGIKLGGNSQQTAIKAADYLLSLDKGFFVPEVGKGKHY